MSAPILPLVVALLSALAAPPTAPLRVRTLDGRDVAAASVSLHEGRLRCAVTGAGEEALEVPLDEVVLVEFRTAGEPAPSARAPGKTAESLLRDGSRLVGRLLPGEDDLLVLKHPVLGRLELPIDLVAAVSFGPDRERLDPTLLPAAGGQDVVLRRGDLEGDRVEGTVTRVGPGGVEVESDLGALKLALEEVSAFVVAASGVEDTAGGSLPGDPQGAAVDVEFGGTERLRGRLLDLAADRMRLRALDGQTLDVPFSGARRLRFRSGRFDWLSDLDPYGVEQTPFLGGDDAFLFPWRRDKTVTGRPLRVAGETFGKGLGLHSRTRLSWRLDGRYVRLSAQVGVADEVLAVHYPVAADLSVSVDGRTVAEAKGLKPGEPARPLDVDLRGAETLEILVDFGETGDVGDRIVVGDPLLVKAGT